MTARVPNRGFLTFTDSTFTEGLFEEPGTLEQVARLARDWFVRYLAQTDSDRANVA